MNRKQRCILYVQQLYLPGTYRYLKEQKRFISKPGGFVIGVRGAYYVYIIYGTFTEEAELITVARPSLQT